MAEAPDYTVYLEKLALFGKILRDQGMTVTPAETEDACRALGLLGLEDRAVVKTALRTIYAKSREEQLRFDRAFDSFFLSEDALRALNRKRLQQEQERRRAMEQARQELQDVPGSGFYSEAQQEAYSQLSAGMRQHMQQLKNQFMNDNRRNPHLYSSFIHSVFAKSILEQQMRMEDAALGGQAVDPEAGLLFKDITGLQETEIPRAVSYIRSLSARINGELSRQPNTGAHSGALNFRRTIRRGLETGGSFVRLEYRRRKRKKRQLVILCDVSASMIQFSEFALRFIQSLSTAADNSRVILFSEGWRIADRFHLQNMDLFRQYVRQCGLYGRGTDLEPALRMLNDARPALLSSSVILLILTDAKSVNPSGVYAQLDRARSKAGKVVCLNPVPQSRWKYSPGLMGIGEHCSMVSCSTLNELALACRRLAVM